jgi:hypothetical protein
VNRADPESCPSKLGYHFVIRFHPPGRSWRFQRTEAALFLVLAATLVVVAIVHTLRHDA